jgi:hypothetical protein
MRASDLFNRLIEKAGRVKRDARRSRDVGELSRLVETLAEVVEQLAIESKEREESERKS